MSIGYSVHVNAFCAQNDVIPSADLTVTKSATSSAVLYIKCGTAGFSNGLRLRHFIYQISSAKLFLVQLAVSDSTKLQYYILKNSRSSEQDFYLGQLLSLHYTISTLDR